MKIITLLEALSNHTLAETVTEVLTALGWSLRAEERGSYEDPYISEGFLIFEKDGKYVKLWLTDDSLRGGYYSGRYKFVTPKTKTIEVWE